MPDPVGVVRQVLAAFARRDAARLRELLHPDLEFHVPTAEAVGRVGPYRGHDGLAEYLADVASAWEELRIEPRQFWVDGDAVVMLGRVYAQGGGRVVDAPVAWLWRLRDGRLAYGRVFDDHGSALAAAGLA